MEKLETDQMLDVKINIIKLNRRNYQNDLEFYEAVSDQMLLLIKNNFVISMYNDIINKEVTIEFSSSIAGELSAIPVWMRPEDYLRYVEYINGSDLSEYIADEPDKNKA